MSDAPTPDRRSNWRRATDREKFDRLDRLLTELDTVLRECNLADEAFRQRLAAHLKAYRDSILTAYRDCFG